MGIIQEYDVLIGGPLNDYLRLSEEVGGPVFDQAGMVKKAFITQREFIAMSLHSPKPASMEHFQSLLKPISAVIDAIHEHREMNRTSQHFNHLSAVSEAIAILGWVVMTPDPAAFAKELHGAGAYYAHKVMAASKDKNSHDVKWAKAWLEVLLELHKFIRQYYRTGLTWNTGGGENIAGSNSAPLPPPPPPMQTFDSSRSQEAMPENDSRSALLKDINKGADITKRLKKVDKSDVTQRTPVTSHPPIGRVAPMTAAKILPPKLALEGRKWCVEFQENNNNIVINATSMNQSVYAYKSSNCQITIKGKINCIILDTCKNIYLTFDDIVSALEVLHCDRIKLQPLGKLQTVIVDKSDGILIYTTAKSSDMTVISSKSSEINIALPDESDGYTERSVPEQFKTMIKGNKLETVAIEKI